MQHNIFQPFVTLAACTAKQCIIIKGQRTTLCCPPIGKRIWDAHPRIYFHIPFPKQNSVQCPYCGTIYTIKCHNDLL